MPRKWPFPQDTALDRARALARTFHAALHSVDPAKAGELEELAREFGEAWVATCEVVEEPDGLMRGAELARYLGVGEGVVRNMASRGVGPGVKRGAGRKLTRYPGGFDPREARELLAWAERARRGEWVPGDPADAQDSESLSR